MVRPDHRSVRAGGGLTRDGRPSAARAGAPPVRARPVPGLVPTRVPAADHAPHDHSPAALDGAREEQGRAETGQHGVRGRGGGVQRAGDRTAVCVRPYPEAVPAVRGLEARQEGALLRGAVRRRPVRDDPGAAPRGRWPSRGPPPTTRRPPCVPRWPSPRGGTRAVRGRTAAGRPAPRRRPERRPRARPGRSAAGRTAPPRPRPDPCPGAAGCAASARFRRSLAPSAPLPAP